MKFSYCITIFLIMLKHCASLNILAVFPHLGKSHFDVFVRSLTHLVERGHNLTIVGFSSLNLKTSNYRFVQLDALKTGEVMELEKIKGSKSEMYGGAHLIYTFAQLSCQSGLASKTFQEFWKEKKTYHLILMEYFNTNCMMGILERYKAPVIGLSSCVLMPWTHQFLANPEHPAYIPVVFMDHSDRMTFLERVENTVVLIANKLYYKYVVAQSGNELSKKYTGVDVLAGEDLMYNTSLVLVNTHFTVQGSKPSVPGIIEVGGIHIGENKALPASLEKYINESPDGVIYFSLGSMIKGHTLPEEKRQAFLKAFARLPQRVLWKWETDTMKDKPDNVLTQKWLPQLDILCHPNVKAFISHGGLLSTTESVHCGVPMLVMPQFGDQHMNAKTIKDRNIAEVLYLRDVTEEKVYNALKKVLTPEFRENAKELSEKFRDRPMSPIDTATYWIEYVARHKGAPHMRTPAVDMPFYQFYLLDVISFLLAICCAVIYVIFIIVSFTKKLVLGKNSHGKKTKIS